MAPGPEPRRGHRARHRLMPDLARGAVALCFVTRSSWWGRPGRPAGGARRHRGRPRRRDRLEAPPAPLPLRRRPGRDQRRGRRGGLGRDPHLRHGEGVRLPRGPGRDRVLLRRGRPNGRRDGALRDDLQPRARRLARAPSVRRGPFSPDDLRRRPHRARAAARALGAPRQRTVHALRRVGPHRTSSSATVGSRGSSRSTARKATSRRSPRAPSCSRPGPPVGSTRTRRTRTAAPGTGSPPPTRSGPSSRTWSSSSSTRPRCSRRAS